MIQQHKSSYIEVKDGDKNEEEQTEDDDDNQRGNDDRLSLKTYEPPMQIQSVESQNYISKRDL